MKPAPFGYCRPDTVEATLAVLSRYGSDGRILAGGMSLGAMLNMRLARPHVVIDINRVDGIDQIRVVDGHVVIGALVRQASVLTDAIISANAPLLRRALPHVGHFQTRNRGTVVGSVAHAEPSAEIPLVLLVSHGFVELASERGRRRIAADDFFVSTLVTARRPEELVTAITLPVRKRRTGYAFDEVANRHGDFALVAAACQLSLSTQGAIDSFSIGLAGIGDRPILIDIPDMLGTRLDKVDTADLAASAAATVSPRGDMHATADYRRQLAFVLMRRTIGAALAEALEGAADA